MLLTGNSAFIGLWKVIMYFIITSIPRAHCHVKQKIMHCILSQAKVSSFSHHRPLTPTLATWCAVVWNWIERVDSPPPTSLPPRLVAHWFQQHRTSEAVILMDYCGVTMVLSVAFCRSWSLLCGSRITFVASPDTNHPSWGAPYC